MHESISYYKQISLLCMCPSIGNSTTGPADNPPFFFPRSIGPSKVNKLIPMGGAGGHANVTRFEASESPSKNS